MIRKYEFKMPEDDEGAFDILEKIGIISPDLAKKLKEAKGMRNIIAHEYGKVDDELVFHTTTEEVENDITEFLERIKKLKLRKLLKKDLNKALSS
ncbi:MAG: DUF86 domain-containing protein [Nanoarchaeota archaeon]